MRKQVLMSLLVLTLSSIAMASYAEGEKEGNFKSDIKGAWGEVKEGSEEVWGGVKKGSKAAWEGSKGAAKEAKKESKSVWQSIKDVFRDEE